jgi:hypothetical protein
MAAPISSPLTEYEKRRSILGHKQRCMPRWLHNAALRDVRSETHLLQTLAERLARFSDRVEGGLSPASGAPFMSDYWRRRPVC